MIPVKEKYLDSYVLCGEKVGWMGTFLQPVYAQPRDLCLSFSIASLVKERLFIKSHLFSSLVGSTWREYNRSSVSCGNTGSF
jgi:hypothetical protein